MSSGEDKNDNNNENIFKAKERITLRSFGIVGGGASEPRQNEALSGKDLQERAKVEGKMAGKWAITYKLNNTLLSNPRVKGEIAREIKVYILKGKEIKTQHTKVCRMWGKRS